MREKIINEVKSFAEKDFATWLKPFLSINENSTEIVLGVRVPTLRNLAKKYKNIDIEVLKQLLKDNIHEIRALAIFIMLIKSKKEPNLMCDLYLDNLKFINNWDLIDYSAPHIVAPYVDKETLRKLSKDTYMWANRVAIVSTIYYIKQGDFSLTLELAKQYINHEHHLIHKASGWMLREIGKKNEKILLDFLKENYALMPTIMRNYATERIKNKTQIYKT